MSTSLLYHTSGIRGYEYRSTEYLCGTTVIRIQQPRDALRCPQCGARDVSARGHLPPGMEKPPVANETVRLNDVVYSSRLGGLLKHYERRTA